MFRLAAELKMRRLILGNLPFLGISYQGRERDRECRERFSDKNEMKRVMRVAIDYGTRFFSASSHRFNELAPLHLEAIREVEEEEGTEIILISCISVPLKIGGAGVNDYKRWKTHVVYEAERFGRDVLRRTLEDPVLNCRPAWRENLVSARPYAEAQLQRRLSIDWGSWEESIDRLSSWRVGWIEPGSETDFLALSRIDLLGELIDRTRDAGYRCLLGSHHLGVTARLLGEAGLRGFDGYVTPINKLGVMMFPTRREAEEAARESRDRGRMIIAIKPFAGGRIIRRPSSTSSGG